MRDPLHLRSSDASTSSARRRTVIDTGEGHTVPDKKPQHPAGKTAAKSLKQKRAAKREKARDDRESAT
jgi:hypothetical protein